MHDKDWFGAIQDFTQAIKLDPSNASAYMGRGAARANVVDLLGALDDLNKAKDFFLQSGNMAAYKSCLDLIHSFMASGLV